MIPRRWYRLQLPTMRKFLWANSEKFAAVVRIVDRAVAIVKEYEKLLGEMAVSS